MAVREILEYPPPRLREVAKPVARVDDEIRRLVDDIAETMYDAPGVGLAAPQIGVGLRVFVIDIASEDEPSELYVFINPEMRHHPRHPGLERGLPVVPGGQRRDQACRAGHGARPQS